MCLFPNELVPFVCAGKRGLAVGRRAWRVGGATREERSSRSRGYGSSNTSSVLQQSLTPEQRFPLTPSQHAVPLVPPAPPLPSPMTDFFPLPPSVRIRAGFRLLERRVEGGVDLYEQ